MSFYGLTKGTACEKVVDDAMKAEAAGTMAYYALARIAATQISFNNTIIKRTKEELANLPYYYDKFVHFIVLLNLCRSIIIA